MLRALGGLAAAFQSREREVLVSAFAVLFSIGLLSRRKLGDGRRRGVIVRSRRVFRDFLRATFLGQPRGLSLAGVAIPALDETKHFKMIGTTGTGKSTAIAELLGAAIRRGDRAVIADPDGGYLKMFHDTNRGDIILNPFDHRSAKWDWAGEIGDEYDADHLAGGLIPRSEDPGAEEWRGYARTLVSALVRRCHRQGIRDPAELWRLIAVADSVELRPLVAGTPAQPFLDPDNARMLGSIRSVAGSAIAAFEYVGAQRARSFSIRDWVRSAGTSSILFVPYTAVQLASLRSMIAAWMRLAIFEVMSRAEAGDQRMWFVIDELDAIGAIDGLKDALARLRKFGGRCVLGFQAIAQVSTTYGSGAAHAIVENCGNTLILRCSASEHGGTSLFASKLIGEREVSRRQLTRGRDRDGYFGGRGQRRSLNISEQTITEAAVLPSELEQLPDLRGYLKIASLPDWNKVRLHRRAAVGHRS